jgi:signal transduction histidine kinase
MTELFRLGFVARVSIILAGSLVFIQILMVMGLYIQRASNTGGSLSLPLPDQVSAAAVLLEKGSAEERATLLRALNGTQFHVSVVSSPPVPEKNWRKMLLTMKQAFQDSVAPSGRNVSIYIHKQHRWLVEGWLPSSKFTVVAQLQSGEYMVMEGSGAFAAIFGFPPGFWAGIMGFGVAILAIIVIRREARPLRRLADAADRLDPSEPRPIADSPRSAPEMRAVISAFNRMQERITALTRSRLELVGAFSHDVRTYATRLRLRAELIADEAERARAVRDIEDMIGLVNDALLAIQDKPSPGVQELVDVAQLVRGNRGSPEDGAPGILPCGRCRKGRACAWKRPQAQAGVP